MSTNFVKLSRQLFEGLTTLTTFVDENLFNGINDVSEHFVKVVNESRQFVSFDDFDDSPYKGVVRVRQDRQSRFGVKPVWVRGRRDADGTLVHMPQTRISEETRARVTTAWPDILDAIARGMPMKDIWALSSTSQYILREYKRSTAGAQDEWDQAMLDSCDALFDQLLELNALLITGAIDPHIARVQMDLLKYLLGKRDPRRYGDKAQIDINLRTVDLTSIINAANARLANAQRAPITLEHAPAAVEGVVLRAVREHEGVGAERVEIADGGCQGVGGRE